MQSARSMTGRTMTVVLGAWSHSFTWLARTGVPVSSQRATGLSPVRVVSVTWTLSVTRRPGEVAMTSRVSGSANNRSSDRSCRASSAAALERRTSREDSSPH